MVPVQCRMARAALGWSLRTFAGKAEVGFNTILRYEAGENARPSNIAKMRLALEKAGVEFIEENGGGPGVRLRKRGATRRSRKLKSATLSS